ncbi:MAG: hypothetical protein DRN28_03135 [Thermoplasmata archaeon]|nr:MAG: hypothetical protein DRN28_03135 [Thermoplasmata archaeon]
MMDYYITFIINYERIRCCMDLACVRENAGGRKRVDMRRLKKFVRERFREGSPLREVILQEKDFLEPDEFLYRLPVWLSLLNNYADQ